MKRPLALLPLVFVALAVLGPLLTPLAPDAIDLGHELEPPSPDHWLGSAENGVDILSVMLAGARTSALVAFLSVGASVLIGVLSGTLAGYVGGRLDGAISALADVVQSFPSIVLSAFVLSLVERPGIVHVALAMSLGGWVLFMRLSRAETLALSGRELLSAVRALGVPERSIVLRHVLPNTLGPIVVQATQALGGAVVAEASLSFLGLGPGTAPSWGALLDQGAGLLLRFPHVALVPGIAIVLTVVGFQASGDALRDRLDPRARRR
jgi:peptide/nickel transport system permease protein